jgi:hypothetical protein
VAQSRANYTADDAATRAPATTQLQLVYTLHPNVTRRRDVGGYFPDTQIEYHAEGGATVTATVTNLWQAHQVLLRYGDACRVLEPPELVVLFRKTAQGLNEHYAQSFNLFRFRNSMNPSWCL